MTSTGVVAGAPETKTVKIDTNLEDKEYYFVDYDASDKDVVNLTEDALTQMFILIEGQDGSSTTKTGTIAIGGETKLKLGGTVAAGDKLTATTGGAGIKTITDHDLYGAIALEAGVSGDIINVAVRQGEISQA